MNDPPPPNLPVLLQAIADARLVVFGDFCVDAYWQIAEEATPELSLETGLPVRRVGSQRYAPGGAGNVVANLRALGVGHVKAIGPVGADLFGDLLRRCLNEYGAETADLLTAAHGWQTPVYIKPYFGETEDSRFDFGGCAPLEDSTIDQLFDVLGQATPQADAVIINQQLKNGACPPALIERVNQLIQKHPETAFVVDSRDCADRFANAVLKLNDREAARICGGNCADASMTEAQACESALRISRQAGKPVFLTRGDNGIVLADSGATRVVPGIQVLEKTDPVGAGDTTAAVIAAGIGAGCEPLAVAQMANIAASITVRKLQTTGAATPEGILSAGNSPDYVYRPEQADDTRHIRYAEGTAIELLEDLPAELNIQHAIFDHDGTLSVLREGWERIMLPMMVRAILGPRYDDADVSLYRRVVEASEEFIDKTTGIQTLVQMQGLIELVARFGCVPAEEMLDEHGYKAIYNEDLLCMVKKRVAKLDRGELQPADFQIMNARTLLDQLHHRGVKLYLASGTDEVDVIAEAEAMGYADIFGGRIFGAVGDLNVEAKKVVLERIIREHGLHGTQFVTFGDGPVEMRETRKRGGVCVGVASDEVRRYDLNPTKRSRLIRAGASIIVPDFSQLDPLLSLLRV